MQKPSFLRSLPLLASLLLSIIVCSPASAQAKIETREYKLADFTHKTIKVVLSGNDIFDEALKAEVGSRWNLNPFEFCTMDSFKQLRKSKDFYFMIPVKETGKDGRATIYFLTIVKGGTGEELSDMLEVASFPICPAENLGGRELVFMGAIVESLQEYATKGTGGSTAVTMRNAYGRSVNRSTQTKRIIFSEEDICPIVDRTGFDADMMTEEEEEAGKMYSEGSYNLLGSYVIAPEDPQKGDWCTCFLFGADDQKIYYMASHKIGGKNGAGFTTKDIKKIIKSRKLK